MSDVTLVKGDATERWLIDDNSLDSTVTDPPYGLAFMGRAWDDKGGPQAYQAWTSEWASEAYRTLKPGGFLLAFGATRMAHRMACGFEDAGFEIVDTIEWLYLTGFTKAQDIGKMFDKRAGATREVVGPDRGRLIGGRGGTSTNHGRGGVKYGIDAPTTPVTPNAKRWDGWKTPALKPAHEPIIVARKPFSGTYIDNIERWGVGAINVDGCRIISHQTGNQPGRFPANVVLSHSPWCTEQACIPQCPVAVLDGQSGELHSQSPETRKSRSKKTGVTGFGTGKSVEYADKGGASKVFAKFFYEEDDFAPFRYCAKATTRERNGGCEHLPNGNDHATVKPKALIRYLQRLVTPPGGITGSPFLGSGTDAVAAIEEGFNFWGMNLPDRDGEEYWPIIEARVAHAQAKSADQVSRPVVEQARLFA